MKKPPAAQPVVFYFDRRNVFSCAYNAFILVGEAKYTFDGSVKLGYTYQYDAMDRITEVRKSSSPILPWPIREPLQETTRHSNFTAF